MGLWLVPARGAGLKFVRRQWGEMRREDFVLRQLTFRRHVAKKRKAACFGMCSV